MANRIRDFSGQKVGMLTVLSRISGASGGGNVVWACVCDCGSFVARNSSRLSHSIRTGKKSNCGCEGSNKKHNLTYKAKRLYMVWSSMKARCYRATCKDFKNYGGRGISVCDDWRNDFSSFYHWAMSTGYTEGISTIERIDVDGNYCPENCTWIVNERQALNTRKVIFLTAKGKTQSLSDWAAELGMRPNTIKTRLRLGWLVDDALFKEVKR